MKKDTLDCGHLFSFRETLERISALFLFVKDFLQSKLTEDEKNSIINGAATAEHKVVSAMSKWRSGVRIWLWQKSFEE